MTTKGGDIKHIFTRVYPSIEDIDKEKELTINVVTDLLNRFVSESNTNTLEYASNALDCYCYVPVKYTLWPGRYVRYLNTLDAFNIKLKVGGFVMSDNGYTVVLSNDKRAFRVDKRNCIWFMAMIESDVNRIRVNAYLK
jgi:hypothetical protein